jgi:hypothetical protein
MRPDTVGSREEGGFRGRAWHSCNDYLVYVRAWDFP